MRSSRLANLAPDSVKSSAATGTRRPSSAAVLCALSAALALCALIPASFSGDSGTGDSHLRLEFPRAPRQDGTYRNLDPEFRRASNWARLRLYMLSFMAIVKGEHHFVPLPVAAPDLTTLRENRHQSTVTWIGHSTVLVQLDGVTFLTDPI